MQRINNVLSGILRHDAKLNTAKLALVRSLNDVALAYAGLETKGKDVVIPLRMLAEFWVAYYWAFMDEDAPILQGPRAKRGGKIWNDFAFRVELTQLKNLWMMTPFGSSRPSDGFVVVAEMKSSRAVDNYSIEFVKQYQRVLRKTIGVIKYPIQYAGGNKQNHNIFPPPALAETWSDATWLPTTSKNDVSLLLPAALWEGFQELSLYVEALCIHEWSLFTERIKDNESAGVRRGDAYTILTERPDNRRPLSWERNQVDILIMEGNTFVCPWTSRNLQLGGYDLDHIIPVAVYPINELWNLVPADPYFNSHRKRALLPSLEKLRQAEVVFALTYEKYRKSVSLSQVFNEDVSSRFGLDSNSHESAVAAAVGSMVRIVAESRNIARFK